MFDSQMLKLVCTVTLSVVDAKDIMLKGVNFVARKGPESASVEDRCKTQEEIEMDLTLLKTMAEKFRLLALDDCDQARMSLIAAEKLQMPFYLGVWVNNNDTRHENDIKYFQKMVEDGLLTDQPLILGVTVGSEAILRGDVSVTKNIAIMKEVQKIIKDANLTLPISITTIDHQYRANSELLEAVDFMSVNVFPFWGKSPIDGAVAGSIGNGIGGLTETAEKAGKPFVISETGWPSDGFNGNGGVASPENSAKYFADFYCEILLHPTWDYYYFTGIDNKWRDEEDGQTGNVEGNFGIYYFDGTMKEEFLKMELNCDGVDYSFSESAKAGLSAIVLDDSSTEVVTSESSTDESTSSVDSIKPANGTVATSDATSQSPLYFVMLMAILIEMMFT